VAADQQAAIEHLLRAAEAAHGAYERAELGGVYDRQWADWYARWLVEHGYNTLADVEIEAEGLSALLDRLFALYKANGSGEDWAAYFARAIVDDLG
jgi:hypothetical protein